MSYDYNQLCSLKHLVIDFLVAKDKISFSVTTNYSLVRHSKMG